MSMPVTPATTWVMTPARASSSRADKPVNVRVVDPRVRLRVLTRYSRTLPASSMPRTTMPRVTADSDDAAPISVMLSLPSMASDIVHSITLSMYPKRTAPLAAGKSLQYSKSMRVLMTKPGHRSYAFLPQHADLDTHPVLVRSFVQSG